MLKGKAREWYYNTMSNTNLTYDEKYVKVRDYFETVERHQKYRSDWRTTTFKTIIAKNPDKSMLTCL
jgi:hypothetical protein